MKAIQDWQELEDELDELKKIFYTFLSRWTEQTSLDLDANHPVLYERHQGEKFFTLDKDRRKQ